MGTKTANQMKDVQGLPDERHVALDEVGVSQLKMPLTVQGLERDPARAQAVQAVVSMSVSLDEDHKGIHMSRLIESFLACEEGFSLDRLADMLTHIRDRQKAERAFIEIDFDIFLQRSAPESRKTAPQFYRVRFIGELGPDGIQRRQSVTAGITTLCPCSKEISEYGAHNQRGELFIETEHDGTGPVTICVEELITVAENAASAPLYPILKREDERHVTMQAYENPRFVEDVARRVAVQFRGEKRFPRYSVQIVNFESIHTHNAFAKIVRRAPQA